MPTLPGQEFGGDGGVDPELGVACVRENMWGERVLRKKKASAQRGYTVANLPRRGH